MKVTTVEAIPFRIPFRDQKVWARGSLTSAEHVLVRVRTDDGLTGIAEAPPRPTIYGESIRSIVTAVEDWLAPVTIGLDPFESEKLLDAFSTYPGNLTAKAAVDMAITDIKAQAAGVPVYKLLGGWTTSFPVTWRVPTFPPAKTVQVCAEMREKHGILGFKIKIGMHAEEDIERLTAVRKELGPDIKLMPDCNQGYEPGVAIRVLKAIEGLDVTLVEEPCRIEDDRGRLRVAESTTIPLMGDESCTTVPDVRRQLALGCVGVISIKVARTGFALSQRIAHMCEAESIPNLCGTQADSSIGTICGAHFAASCRNVKLPSELTGFLDTLDDLLVEPPTITDGTLSVPERPGLGMEIDEKKLAKYRF